MWHKRRGIAKNQSARSLWPIFQSSNRGGTLILCDMQTQQTHGHGRLHSNMPQTSRFAFRGSLINSTSLFTPSTWTNSCKSRNMHTKTKQSLSWLDMRMHKHSVHTQIFAPCPLDQHDQHTVSASFRAIYLQMHTKCTSISFINASTCDLPPDFRPLCAWSIQSESCYHQLALYLLKSVPLSTLTAIKDVTALAARSR